MGALAGPQRPDLVADVPPAAADPARWRDEWPLTDFTRHSVGLDEIVSGGVPRDGIPSIDDPAFVPVVEAELPANEPVIGLMVEGDARAYPLRILIWHETVNDPAAGAVAATYRPLCNTGVVFDRRQRAAASWSSAPRASCATRTW